MTIALKFSQKILLAASLVVVAAFALFSAYDMQLQRRTISKNLEASLSEISRLTAANIARWLDGRIRLVESEAQALARDHSTAATTAVLGQKVYQEQFLTSFFGQADGVHTTRPIRSVPADYDPRKRPWYVSAAGAGTTILTPPYVFASTGKLGMTIAAPVLNQGQLSGVVGGDLSLETLQEIVTSFDKSGHGQAFLVDQNGTVLVSANPTAVLKGLAELFPDQAPTVGQGFQEIRSGQQDYVVTFSEVAGLPSVKWYLGLAVDKEIAYAPLTEALRSAVVGTLLAVVVVVLLLGCLIRILLTPLRQIGEAMGDIAKGEGDLTRRLPQGGKDEFGELAAAFNHFVGRVHGSITEVSSSARQLSHASRRVLDVSTASLQQSDEQDQRTQSVAAAINELGAAAQEIAGNAASASGEATSARGQAEEGRTVLEQAQESMQVLSKAIGDACANIAELNHRTDNIGKILDVIQGISGQINLLALNAAIEAARAGEAGRGFAVVADEVRSLAHRTQSSASQIQGLIEELQVGARSAVDQMVVSQRQSQESLEIANDASERFGGVTLRMGHIDGQNLSVATATEEQTAVVEALNIDISEINGLNQRSVKNLKESLDACRALDQEAARLQRLVDGFRI